MSRRHRLAAAATGGDVQRAPNERARARLRREPVESSLVQRHLQTLKHRHVTRPCLLVSCHPTAALVKRSRRPRIETSSLRWLLPSAASVWASILRRMQKFPHQSPRLVGEVRAVERVLLRHPVAYPRLWVATDKAGRGGREAGAAGVRLG